MAKEINSLDLVANAMREGYSLKWDANLQQYVAVSKEELIDTPPIIDISRVPFGVPYSHDYDCTCSELVKNHSNEILAGLFQIAESLSNYEGKVVGFSDYTGQANRYRNCSFKFFDKNKGYLSSKDYIISNLEVILFGLECIINEYKRNY